MRPLPYLRPTLGRDYWVLDDFLPDAMAIMEEAHARSDWVEGFPHRPEHWPGRRSRPALGPVALASVEQALLNCTQASRVFQATVPAGDQLDHNVFQLVGGAESGPRPHTDSKLLTHYAGVLYLSPEAPPHAGTSFYRMRTPGGPGGNLCPATAANLVEALGVPRLPADAWIEDVTVENKFNRLLLYRADLVHSASAYFGRKPKARRLTALFFWLADPPPPPIKRP